jgi:hypothetical protein
VWVDLRPGKDRAAEVAYLLELGGRRVGAELTDPEGNEFHVLDDGA